jgi:hypothetical protein
MIEFNPIGRFSICEDNSAIKRLFLSKSLIIKDFYNIRHIAKLLAQLAFYEASNANLSGMLSRSCFKISTNDWQE